MERGLRNWRLSWRVLPATAGMTGDNLGMKKDE